MPIPCLELDRCLTVTQLKAIVAGWPEIDQFGEPQTVHVSVGERYTMVVIGIEPVDVRKDHDGNETAILSICIAEPWDGSDGGKS